MTKSREFAFLGLVISLAGLLSRPEILAIIPAEYSNLVTAVGIIIQTLAKQLVGE